MNIQPYGVPDKHWPPKLTTWWFHGARPFRRRTLRKQQITHIEVEGLEHLQSALRAGHGILLTPNHSFHWDSYCLLEAAERLSTPFYFMSAWQVFALSSWFQRISMQRCGCFSVDREGTDMQAMKTAVDIMQNRPHPLVIFPEGDVYHTNDRIMPFRDGAAAMALMAARKAERQVVIIPVAIKRWYVQDPTPSLLQTLEQLERRLYWRPRTNQSIQDRIFQIAEGLLSLKELERFRQSRSGPLPDRIQHLANSILSDIESRYNITPSNAMLPERVKEVRRRIIQLRQEPDRPSTSEEQQQWASDMDDMFLVTQLYSYPGDYLVADPTWERLAETLDKLEEDALGASYPCVRGERHAKVRFDRPMELPRGKDKKLSAADLTDQIEQRVQSMIDDMNREYQVHRQNIVPSELPSSMPTDIPKRMGAS